MADRVEIEVVTTGNPKGAEAVAESLDKTGKAAEEAGKKTTAAAKEIGDGVKKMEGDAASSADSVIAATEGMVPAWDAAHDAAEDAGDAVNDMGEKVKEAVPDIEDMATAVDSMSGSLNMGSDAAKGGGRSLDGYLAMIKGAAARISVFIGAAKAGWDIAKKMTERLSEIEEVSNMALPTLARTSQDAAIEQAELKNYIDQTARATRQGEKAFDDYARRLRSLADEQAGLVDAQLGLELAQIDLAELNENVTEAEAIQMRYNARRSARERKSSTEIEAIETELNNRRMQNEQDWANYLATQPAAREAQGRLDQAQQKGASAMPELADLRDARNAANKARAAAPKTTSREDIAALDKAVDDAQQALEKGFAEIIKDLVEARDEALAASVAAKSNVDAGQSDQRRLERELENATSGPAAQARALGEREAAVRLEADLYRAQPAAENPGSDKIGSAKAIDVSAIEVMPQSSERDQFLAAIADGIERREVAFLQSLTRSLDFQAQGMSPSVRAELDQIRAQLDDLRTR